jgi:hypothetical protein
METLIDNDKLKEQALIEANFTLEYQDRWGQIFVSKKRNPTIMMCKILTPYVLEEDFKKLVMQCTTVAQKTGCDKYIFDKRALKTFHQPSMEWYYVYWKPYMYKEFQLKKHRKLFLMEEWWLKCIEIGRNQIYKKYPNSICHSLDIKVSRDLEDAINN